MQQKKRIFIGSSSESRELAYALQNALQEKFECVLWYEGFFSLGNHFYTDLVQKIITFDYAIMIGGEDDLVTRLSTNAQKTAPRDNVYLEYGLFSSLLSPARVLFLLHRNCVAASDLAGMSLLQYSENNEAVALAKGWLEGLCAPKKARVLGRQELELLPTVGVAVGYFYNFLKPFCERLLQSESAPRFCLQVLVPDFVCDDILFYKREVAWRENAREEVLERFRILVRKEENGALTLFDVPSTVLTLFKTVNYIFDVQEGNSEDTLCAKARALENFCDHLQVLVAGDMQLRRLVSIKRFGEQE